MYCKSFHNSKISMIFKTIISDINKVALAIDSLQGIKITGTVNQLNNKSLSEFVKGIDGLTLSQANAALSTKALTDAQKEQILTSAGLLQSSEAITLEEVKQMASSMSLSAQKKEEILTTLQGAYAENEWNKEKLEAIVASGGEAGAIAQTILAKKAENAENIRNIASGKALTKSLKEELVTRLSLMATNPAFWIAGIVAAGVGLVALQEKFSKSLKECTEELEAYNSEFETTQSSVESLEAELKTCNERLSELQKLADNGTISIIEQEEYERLQKTNDELERNLRIEREKAQLSAIDSVKSADETLNKTVESKYVTSLQDFSGVGVETEYSSWITPEKELNAAIEEYKRLQIEIDNLNKAYDNGEISTSDYEKQLSSLTDQQTKARTRASEMNDILSDCKQAYDNLDNTGGSFTTTQKNNYNAVTEANKRYNEFLGTINGVNEAFENLDTTEKAQTLKDKYAQKTLSLPNGQGSYTVDDKEISDWIDTLSDEDLSILGTINFSGEQTKDSMQEALDYAKTHTEVTSDELSDLSATISSSVQQIATQLEPQFKKLGEAYKAIFTDNGFTLEDVDNSMLEGLRKSFAEIEEEVGVAFDSTKLNSFFDALTDGSGTSEEQAKRVQQAFNDLATAYFNSTDTLAQLNEETADSIAKQLEELGIVNAKEVVYDKLNAETEALALKEQLLAAQSDAVSRGASFNAEAFLKQAGATEIVRATLFKLITEEQVFGNTDLNTADKIAKLKELANAYGQTAIAARIANLEKANENGHIAIDYDKELASLQNDINNAVGNVKIDFSGVGGGTSGASKAGKSAGDAYVEAYEKEVKKLDDLKSQGKITEKQYLDYLRKLYEKYFKNIGKYAEKFAEEQAKYLSGLKSLYESALSGITSMLSKQMDSYSDQKDAAVDALEEQKEAAVDALEAERDSRIKVLEIQRKQIEEQIKAKQKIIDSIREEIDAMQEANENRKKALDLQNAQYTLEKLQNQKTNLVYTESKGMAYQTDTSGIREAKQNVEDKKLEIEIANKEKQISLIEKEINLLEEQKDSIDEQIDQINEYYDNLIEQTEKSFDEMIKNTEKYWDELIKGLENYKSRWEELAELEENAKLMATLKELGIETEDILGMSEEAFSKFRDEYVGILADIYSGNDTMTNALADSLGTTTDKLGSYIDSTQGYIDSLSGSADVLQPVADALNGTAEGMDKLGTSASTASTNTSKIASDMSTLNTNTTGLSDELDGISKALSNMPEASKFEGISKAFSELAKSIGEVSKVLGVGTEGTVGGLLQALTDISEISLGGEDGQGTGIISQFNNLKTAVEGVSSAISGGGSTGASDGTSTSSSPSMSAGATEGNTGGLTGAIDTLKSKSDTAIGSKGSDDSKKESSSGDTVIGSFEQLKGAVDDVSNAIGLSEDADTPTEGVNADGSTLTGAIVGLGETTKTVLGSKEDTGKEAGVIGKFQEFTDVIGEANTYFSEMLASLQTLSSQEWEVKVTVTGNGAMLFESNALFTGGGNGIKPDLEYKGTVGNAFAKGYPGLEKREKNALRSEFGQPELTVYPDGRYEITTTPTMSDLPKGTVIFNEEQTNRILSNSGSIGKAYADGNVGNTPIISIPDTFVLGRDGFEGMAGINLFNDFINSVATPMTSIDKNVDNISKNISNVNNNRTQSFSVGDITVHCTGITSADVAKEVGTALQKEFSGMALKAYQKANITR